MHVSTILTWVCQPIHTSFEASELNDSSEACESIFDLIKKVKFVCERVEHIFVPESDVKLSQIMQTLQFQRLLFVLNGVNQNPYIPKDWLVLFELNVLKDEITSTSSLSRLLLSNLFFQRILRAQDRSPINIRPNTISHVHEVVYLPGRLQVLFFWLLVLKVVLILFKKRPPLQKILKLIDLEIKRALLDLRVAALIVSHSFDYNIKMIM